jgi:plasmid maintenance system antidote protein VapI
MVMRMLRPLARFFETTPEFWMNLQRSFDLRTAEIDAGSKIAHDVQPMTTHP